MNTINPIGKPLVVFLLFVVLMAVAFGLSVARYDPWGQASEARQRDTATDYQRQINVLDLQVKTAQTQADLERIAQEKALLKDQIQQELVKQQALDQAEVERQKQLNALEIERLQRQEHWKDWAVLAGVVTLFTGANAVIISVVIRHRASQPKRLKVISAKSRLVDVSGANIAGTQDWNSPEYRRAQRQKARELETRLRQNKIAHEDWPQLPRG
jgi:hypothetical protein